jgi:hypothetical protein
MLNIVEKCKVLRVKQTDLPVICEDFHPPTQETTGLAVGLHVTFKDSLSLFRKSRNGNCICICSDYQRTTSSWRLISLLS